MKSPGEFFLLSTVQGSDAFIPPVSSHCLNPVQLLLYYFEGGYAVSLPLECVLIDFITRQKFTLTALRKKKEAVSHKQVQ